MIYFFHISYKILHRKMITTLRQIDLPDNTTVTKSQVNDTMTILQYQHDQPVAKLKRALDLHPYKIYSAK